LAGLDALALGGPLIVHIAFGEEGFVLPIPAAEPGAQGFASTLQPAAAGDGGCGLAGLDHEAVAANRQILPVAAENLVAAEGPGRPIQLQILAVEIELFDGIADLHGGLELVALLTGIAVQACGGKRLWQSLGGSAGGQARDPQRTLGFQVSLPRLPGEPLGQGYHFGVGTPLAAEGVTGLAPALDPRCPLQFESVAIEEEASPLGPEAV